jgi:hypothetical protein
MRFTSDPEIAKRRCRTCGTPIKIIPLDAQRKEVLIMLIRLLDKNH